MRRTTALLLLLVFFVGSAWIVLCSLPGIVAIRPDGSSEVAGAISSAMAQRMRNIPYLSTISPNLRFKMGHRLQNGVYVTDTMLIEDYTPPDPALTQANTEALSRLIDGMRAHAADYYGASSPLYFMLVPTASAVKTEDVPGHAYPYDQQQLISAVYYQNNLPEAPVLNLVRAYEALDRVNSEYIYYRTDSALTGLGGYYLYLELAGTMRLTPYTLGQFDVNHVRHDYRGGLNHRAYSNHIRSDLISVYRFSGDEREYRVIHRDGDVVRYYNTLFPMHVLETESPTDVVLGGLSKRVDIQSVSPYDESLLILTDETLKSYISFLAIHFERVTILDVNTLDSTALEGIDLMEYDRVLISLSLDLYTHSDKPASAMAVLCDHLMQEADR